MADAGKGTGPEAGLAIYPSRAMAGDGRAERRDSCRYRTVFRVAEVNSRAGAALCRVRNISDNGMMLRIDNPIGVGEALRIGLSDTVEVTGRVAWAAEDLCGVLLDRSIDAAATLKSLSEDQRSGRYRKPRLRVDLAGVAYSERGLHAVRATDLSQHGIGLTHDGRLEPDMKVMITFENGLERHATVHWASEQQAGLSLTEPLSCSELNRYLTRDADLPASRS